MYSGGGGGYYGLVVVMLYHLCHRILLYIIFIHKFSVRWSQTRRTTTSKGGHDSAVSPSVNCPSRDYQRFQNGQLVPLSWALGVPEDWSSDDHVLYIPHYVIYAEFCTVVQRLFVSI